MCVPELEASKVNVYCENEAANLILSSFAARAQHDGIDFRVHAAIRCFCRCRTAICACCFQRTGKRPARRAAPEAGRKPAVVETTAYEKDGRLFVQIANSCSFPVQFDAQGVPTTNQPATALACAASAPLWSNTAAYTALPGQQDQFVLRISL